MKLELVSTVFLAISIVYAFPAAESNAAVDGGGGIDWSKHGWIAPKASDLRSPCPGLNTLANHGFLPRDGRGLTVENVIKAAKDGFNVEPDVVSLPSKVGLTASANFNSTFTLKDIRLHNSIEHDASVSRQDFFFGDNFSFNETIFSALLNSNPGVDYYNATSAGEVQRLRLIDSEARNPTTLNTVKELAIRTRESSLYLSVMGNVTSTAAPKKFVNIFFREERLPREEGWTRSPIPISGDAMDPMATIIIENSQWSANSSQCSSVLFTLDSNDSVTF